MARSNCLPKCLRMTGIAVVFCFSSNALAQEEESERVDHIEALKACQDITDPTSRLNCFDRAVSTMVSATEEGELQLVDKEDVTKTRRRLFGFSLPNLGIFGGGDGEEDELDMLESTVTRVISVRGDKVVFEIEEGSIWQISDAPARIIRRIDRGTPVVFKKAALGSYFIRVDGRTGVKGKRIE